MGTVYLGEHTADRQARRASRSCSRSYSPNAGRRRALLPRGAKRHRRSATRTSSTSSTSADHRRRARSSTSSWSSSTASALGAADRARRAAPVARRAAHRRGRCCAALAAAHAQGHRPSRSQAREHLPHHARRRHRLRQGPRLRHRQDDRPRRRSVARRSPGMVHRHADVHGPEQCEGKGPSTTARDVYSLGASCTSCSPARVPFPGEGFGEVLVAHLTRAGQAVDGEHRTCRRRSRAS